MTYLIHIIIIFIFKDQPIQQAIIHVLPYEMRIEILLFSEL